MNTRKKFRKSSKTKASGYLDLTTHRRSISVTFDDDVFEYLAEQALNNNMSFGNFVNSICKEKVNGLPVERK